MKIVNIFGGLGNQMFQYALMIALKSKYGEDVLADTHYLADYKRHNGLELEHVFAIKLPLATAKDVKRVAFYAPNYKIHRIAKHLHIKKPSTVLELLSRPYHDDVFVEKNRYYDGYWQDPRYFEDVNEKVKASFAFRNSLDERNERLCQEICCCNSIGIHVRRGDYLKNNRYQDICDVDYYSRAIEHIKQQVKEPCFYVFSNDIKWCKDELARFLEDCSCFYVDWNGGKESWKDMQLMANCHSLIIANSSFSWWAAYLKKSKGVVVAPKTWFHSTPPLQIQLDEWHLL